MGYLIVGLALFLFVQARNVFPQLLLARIFFSMGAAATSTMVTAVLPCLVSPGENQGSTPGMTATSDNDGLTFPSAPSEVVVTEQRNRQQTAKHKDNSVGSIRRPATTRLAGFVGLFTGCGALLALSLFLPLPTFLRARGENPGLAVTHSYYIVGATALLVGIGCLYGLRGLRGEQAKSLKWQTRSRGKQTVSIRLLSEAFRSAFRNSEMALAYFGGFVARASSVGISLFLPLYINAFFNSTGRCHNVAHNPGEIKGQCRRAYILAAELSGVSQLVALLFAPVFGYTADRFPRFNIPLLVAAIAGIIGYLRFVSLRTPDPKDPKGSPWVFVVVSLLGISQIGAIVCSLGLLGRSILTLDRGRPASNGSSTSNPQRERVGHCEDSEEVSETSGLLRDSSETSSTREHLKGSIAGVYSLAGGAGILLLTKLGGYLFDEESSSAPFYMLSVFNGLLLLFGLGCALSEVYHTGPFGKQAM